MSVLIDKYQGNLSGFTGTHGTFHSEQVLKYGTNLVGGLHQRKEVKHTWVYQFFNTVEKKHQTNANATMIMFLQFAASAIIGH